MSELSRPRDKSLIGLLFILLGILFLLNNLGILDLGFDSPWLPLLLILIGSWLLFQGSLFGSIVLLGIGLLWLFHNLDLLEWRILWPLLLILLGITFLFKKSFPAPFRKSSISQDEVHLFTLFGGSETKVESKNFRGGTVTSLFGGIDLDLREAQLAVGEKPQELNVSAIFGGVEIRVPEEWTVILRGTPILGGIEDARRKKSSTTGDSPFTLLINAFALFGGIEVR